MTPPDAAAQIGAVLGKMVAQGEIASADDASLYVQDDAIRSNQGAANPWVVAFFERAGLTALVFVRPAPPLQAVLRALTRNGAPIVAAPREAPAPRPPDLLVVRAGSAAALEQALADRGGCLIRGTGPDGDEVTIAACSPLSLHDALARFRRIAHDCRRHHDAASPPG